MSALDVSQRKLVAEFSALLQSLRNEKQLLQQRGDDLGSVCAEADQSKSANVVLLHCIIETVTEANDRVKGLGRAQKAAAVHRFNELDQMRRKLDEYKQIAGTDSLTHLPNRRAFDERLALMFEDRCEWEMSALILLDIDHFKRVNDTHGHLAGDKVLTTVASILRVSLKKEVFVARTGGEEFAIVVGGQTSDEVTSICESVRLAIAGSPFRGIKSDIDYGPITISLGFCMVQNAVDAVALYGKADEALYHAKHSGRNRTVDHAAISARNSAQHAHQNTEDRS
ncbi:GGDEF domain-containing protein [Rhizobium sp. NPDC090275]|uniref:GGDEF domain-containing protein n=1 Tax=Rhizobium sp. NPDC090275 TaxID=3364498 RepID=UPI00383B315B